MKRKRRELIAISKIYNLLQGSEKIIFQFKKKKKDILKIFLDLSDSCSSSISKKILKVESVYKTCFHYAGKYF